MYVHKEDLSIDRCQDEVTEVFGCDGDLVCRFPSNFTDEQIYHAMDIANKLYDKGVEAGKAAKAYEIKSVLGIN